MALYESVFIARQDVSSSQVDGIADTLQKVIEDNGGQVAKREYWGLRNLSYKIKKNRKGHYALFNIDAPAEALREYERTMKLNEDILRFMTIKVDELDPEPSVVMQNKGRDRERGDRGDRGGRGGRRFDERPPREGAQASGDEKPAAAAESGNAETAASEPEKTGDDA
jgi:small subunit ribosomal protein S6